MIIILVKIVRLSYIIIPFVLIGIITPVFSQTTQVIYLSGTDAANTVEWDFFCTDGRKSGEWLKIQVPSNWELQGFGTYN